MERVSLLAAIRKTAEDALAERNKINMMAAFEAIIIMTKAFDPEQVCFVETEQFTKPKEPDQDFRIIASGGGQPPVTVGAGGQGGNISSVGASGHVVTSNSGVAKRGKATMATAPEKKIKHED